MIQSPRIPGQMEAGPLTQLAGRFRFNSTMFDLLTDEIVGDDWSRCAGRGNSAHWILGHLCTMRLSLLRTLGVEESDRVWEPQFAVSGAVGAIREEFPLPEELLRCFRGTDRELAYALEQTSATSAEAEWEQDELGLPVTVEECVGFFYFDETFHLGQLGLARQQLGKPRVI